ncbi:NMRAL1 protein [Kalaharituber pfeilii]|nr:NMRAL1 protein [Kalaharituber pfeilii]
MSDKKVLVIFGATGKQGGSIIQSIQDDPRTASTFAIRGITRDANKPNALALKEKGVEVVTADMEDKESLKKALKGAYAVFVVTNYWEHLDAKRETQQGKNVADVAAELGVQHYIFSSLYNIKELSGGTLSKMHHFDSKAEVESYIRTSLPNLPSTFFLPGFYMSNIPGQQILPDPSTGVYTFGLPVPGDKAGIPMFDVRDTGKFIKGILLNREKTLGKRVLGATKYMSPNEVLEVFKKVKAETAKEKGAQYNENMVLLGTYGYYGWESLDWSHSIVDEPLTTWEEFVATEPAWADLK